MVVFNFQVKSIKFNSDAINNFDGGTRFVTGVRKTAGIFATYPQDYLSVGGGLLDQVLGTAMLCFFVAMITDRRNKIPEWIQPTLLGLMLMLVGMAWGMNVSSLYYRTIPSWMFENF